MLIRQYKVGHYVLKLITFVSIMLFTTLFFSVSNVMAQNNEVVNESVKEEIQETASESVTAQTLPIDITTITGILGTAGGLLWKDRKDKKDLEKQLKECMDILMNLEVGTIKFFNASMVYPEKTVKQILELKAANNAMENLSIAGEMSVHVARLQKFMMFNFHTPMPNMSIPSERVINSTTVVAENKVTQIESQPSQTPAATDASTVAQNTPAK